MFTDDELERVRHVNGPTQRSEDAGSGSPNHTRARDGQIHGVVRLKSVDALRGLAALAVVVTHMPRANDGAIDAAFFARLPMDFGTLGVPLFLVISGFCIHLAVARRAQAGAKASVDWAAFWKRRFYRLYPPYLAAIAFSLAVYLVLAQLGGLRPQAQLESFGTDLASHLLLVHNLLPGFSDGLFNPPFWTLALEEQLYGLFVVVLVLRRRLSIIKVLWISLAVALIWRWSVVWIQFFLVLDGVPRSAQVISLGSLPAIGAWGNWPFSWWFLWLLGAVAAEAYTSTITLPKWAYSPVLAIGMAAFGALTYFRTLGRYTEFWLTDIGPQGWLRAGLNTVGSLSELAFGVSCFVLLIRWVRAERQGRFTGRLVAMMSSVGVFSYSLYLAHVPTIAMLEWLIPLGPRASLLGTLARTVVYVPICVAMGYAFFIVVERHFLKHSRAQGVSGTTRKAPLSAT